MLTAKASKHGGLIPAHAGKTTGCTRRRRRVAAHPRSRGENRFAGQSSASQAGSSPLTRGKHVVEASQRVLYGLIPAHAGKTVTTGQMQVVNRAHPRSRGENLGRRTGARLRRGSSPLTRGKPPCNPRKQATQQAHPRSRGENITRLTPVITYGGSSPLTRGKHIALYTQAAERRLIPAHAGKTQDVVGVHAAPWAHPRSRGENVTINAGWDRLEGSSPLTRGKPRLARRCGRSARLIPAHAGKTPCNPRKQATQQAHPRSRGENLSLYPLLGICAGSSPLTRGKHRGCARGSRRPGLIPAHAGKTGRRQGFASGWGAHPRSRGENVHRQGRAASRGGSSPLTRGKHSRARLSSLVAGLIPAHAGKTLPSVA